jgi:2-methylisocitrate lyase-like PEP mutase family enzyme
MTSRIGAVYAHPIPKAIEFRALHQRDGAFIIPNPWYVGTAQLVAHLGFEVLATTSAEYAHPIGRLDYSIGRVELLKQVGDIVLATDLPVSVEQATIYHLREQANGKGRGRGAVQVTSLGGCWRHP